MNKEKRITPYSLIAFICCVISVFLYGSCFYFGIIIRNSANIILQIVVYFIIVILLFFRKKNIIWLFPLVAQIWLWKNEYFNVFLHNFPSNIRTGALCLLLAYVTIMLILLCNVIPAFEKIAKKIDKFVWFIPAVLLFVGYEVQCLGHLLRSLIEQLDFYKNHAIFFNKIAVIVIVEDLVNVIVLLCIGMWIKTIYQKPKKVRNNYMKSEISVSSEIYCGMAKHILLLLFTFGIWYYIWIYRMTGYTNAAENEEYRNPTKKLLLCLFVPFYLIYWTYKTAQRVDKMAVAKGISSDMTTLCLILAIFVPIIPPILLQDKMNNIATTNDTQSSVPKVENENSTTLGTAEELKKFKELLDGGVITQEEFDAKKKQLLGL